MNAHRFSVGQFVALLALLATAFVLLTLPVYAQKSNVRCTVNASSVVRDREIQTIPEGRVVRLEGTTTSKGKLVGYITDFERGHVLGWIDWSALTCTRGDKQ